MSGGDSRQIEKPYPASVADSAWGKALLAETDLPAGVIVAKFTGPLVRSAELPESEICYALWLNEDEWMIPTSSARYANHSCSPNCKVNDDFEVLTIQAVRAGEQLTFTYNRIYPGEVPPLWDQRWNFKCLCGSPDCQGDINGWRIDAEA